METQYVDSEDGSPSKSNSFYEKRGNKIGLTCRNFGEE